MDKSKKIHREGKKVKDGAERRIRVYLYIHTVKQWRALAVSSVRQGNLPPPNSIEGLSYSL